jgi:hypothetical protein
MRRTTRPALRKWLLNDMRDDDGDSVNVAWPRSFWSWFKDNRHPQERFSELAECLKPKEVSTESPRHLAKRLAKAKEAAAKLQASHHIRPVSFPEGTLVAALKRRLRGGSGNLDRVLSGLSA